MWFSKKSNKGLFTRVVLRKSSTYTRCGLWAGWAKKLQNQVLVMIFWLKRFSTVTFQLSMSVLLEEESKIIFKLYVVKVKNFQLIYFFIDRSWFPFKTHLLLSLSQGKSSSPHNLGGLLLDRLGRNTLLSWGVFPSLEFIR